MKSTKISLFVYLALATVFYTCKEDTHTPINSGSEAPARIQNPVVENLAGGAKITYALPEGTKSVLYVQAEYQIRPGVVREAKSSYYTNSLVVDGFGQSGEYEVKLYTVGRNEKRSEPVSVKINPLPSAVTTVFKSLVVKEDWGGISFSFQNANEANLAVEVITPDSLGDWTTSEIFYTKMKEARFSVRGFEPVKRRFGIFLRDRWDNRSDTIMGEYTPMLEQFLDKSKFKEMNLPTDYNAPHSNGTLRMSRIWDGQYTSETDFVTVPGKGLPQWFTFDLGSLTKLSRIVLFKRISANFLYNSGAVKKWELWGSANPNPDGSFDDSWTLLSTCQSIKPSGLPPGQNTNEDRDYAAKGEEFEFPADAPPVRYIRWKTLENWGNVTHVNITEIDVFGQPR
jgi:hypothetical protein